MYDMSQLNEMLLPELQDIAETLHIDDFKKLPKQELVFKILDRQAEVGAQKGSAASDGEKRKRKRIVKATTANTTEEAVVEDTSMPAIEKRR
jgi:transcription termination factor Rho